MSRLLSLLLALSVLALALSWALGPCVPIQDLGPGDELLALPGSPVFVVRRDQTWWRFPTDASRAEQGLPLPANVRGRPILAADGSLLLASADGLLSLRPDGTDELLALPENEGPLILAGVDHLGQPVLRSSASSGGGLRVRHDGAWLSLPDALPPEDARVLISAWGPSLAFGTRDGWQAWSWGAGVPVQVTAEGSRGQHAVFTPDGKALIVEGRTDGLFQLNLTDGRLAFMSLGNLGVSRRVPFGAAFRGDPLLLLAPQLDMENHLHVFQTHVSGGGRSSLTTGSDHHYAPTVSHDGRRLAYCQARFSEQLDGAFEESVYVFDFDRGAAVQILRRPGGQRGAGPVFTGTDGTLLLLANGRVRAVKP